LQDRLVKELRLAGAATLAEGNVLLPSFIADDNARFAKAPANSKDLHRRLGPDDDLDDAFAWKEERTLSRALTLQYDKVLFILEPSELAKPAPGREQGAAIGKRVTVVDDPDGRLVIRHRGVELAYRTSDKIRQVSQAAIVSSAPRSPSSARSSCVASPSIAVIVHRGAVISTTLVCSKSAERFYEPGVLRPPGKTTGAVSSAVPRSSVGRCAAQRLRARPPPEPSALTFLNWGKD
jgi:hypothetical protein